MRQQSPSLDSDFAPLANDMVLFARVIEARSLSGAARTLGTTTSAVSKRLARLEDRLGVRLLERTTRRIALTEAGALFHERCVRVLSEVEDAERETSSLTGEPRGTLRVSAPVLFGESYVAPVVAELAARHPALRIELSLSDRFVNIVEEGFDCAVRIGNAADSTLVALRIGRVPKVCVASPSYLARHGAPARPEDLARHICLRYAPIPMAQEWRFRGEGNQEYDVPVVGTFITDHGGAVRAAAIAGLGIARLPLFLVEEPLRAGLLREVLGDFRAAELGVSFVHPARRHMPAKVRALGDLLVERLRPRLRAMRA